MASPPRSCRAIFFCPMIFAYAHETRRGGGTIYFRAGLPPAKGLLHRSPYVRRRYVAEDREHAVVRRHQLRMKGLQIGRADSRDRFLRAERVQPITDVTEHR